MKRRAVLAGTIALSGSLSGCTMPRLTPKEFALNGIEVENQATVSREVTIVVEDRDEVVFIDSVTASPAKWDGDELVRQGGAVIKNPVSTMGDYTVHVRLESGPIHTFPVSEVASNGGCVRVAPNIERDGSFHFEHAYCSNDS